MQSPYQNVADRYRLKTWRRPINVPWARRRWMWGIGLGAALAGLGFGWLARGERMWWSHPVSTAHGMIESKCSACHQDGFQHVRISWHGPDYLRDLEGRTCQTCHQNYATDDHHAGLMDAAQAGSCFSCHQEHQGRELLAWVDDAHCTNCHADLKSSDGEQVFAGRITAFDDHPEFALRRPADGGLAPLRESAGHEPLATWNRGQLAAELARVEQVDGEAELVDRSRIRFNHAYHLQPGGVPIPPTHANFEESKTKRLDCADCHQPDGDGRYMQPISYEKHCQECHLLVVSERFVDKSAELPRDRYLPHEKPEVIRGILRERLLASIDEAPAQPPRLPTKSLPITAVDKWQQVDEMLKALDATVVGSTCGVMPEQQREHLHRVQRGHAPFLGVETGCAHCHFIKRPKRDIGHVYAPLEFEIEPPRIPDRWYPHSRFRHDKHDAMSCASCHYLDAGQPGSIRESETARDILLPSIETCRQCHGAENRTPGGQARSACVECHGYHHPAPAAGQPLEELLKLE
jgi:hypothetical protein